jgi:hypothetical protein
MVEGPPLSHRRMTDFFRCGLALASAANDLSQVEAESPVTLSETSQSRRDIKGNSIMS